MEQIEKDARDYVALLSGRPNGWGQHVHRVYGVSHNMLCLMREKHGQEAFDAAIDREIERLTVAAYIAEGLGE